MNRLRTPGPRDDSPLPETGDLAFVGMDMRAPALVPPGFVSHARNMRVEDGVYETRKGLFYPAWGAMYSDSFPFRPVSSITALGQSTTYGATTYDDPGEESQRWIVIARTDGLYFFRETEVGRRIPLFGDLQITADVQLIQAFNKIIVLRGLDSSILEWSGNWIDKVKEPVYASAGSGYAIFPPAVRGILWRDRLWAITDRDELIASRIADSTQYHSGDVFTINNGGGDALRALCPLGDKSLLLFKDRTLHLLTADAADLSDVDIDQASTPIDFVSPKCVVPVGNQVWFLDRSGIRAIELSTGADGRRKLVVVPRPVSAKIQRVFGTVDWGRADTFCASVFDNRVRFSLYRTPQYGTRTWTLVFNLLTGEWESFDYSGFSSSVNSLLDYATAPWLGQTRLFGVNNYGQPFCLDYNPGEDVYLSTSGSGESLTQTWERSLVSGDLTSRGYTGLVPESKRFQRMQVGMETWYAGTAGNLSLFAFYDGAGDDLLIARLGERQTLTPITRNRAKYFTQKADFDLTNENGDFHTARRQDYSIALADSSASLRVDTFATAAEQGVRPEDFQSFVERRELGRDALFAQIRLTHSGGAVRLTSLGVEATLTDHSNLRQS